MNKPFSMMCEEFKQNVVNLINSSGLPPFVIESILKNHLNEVSNIVNNQYQIDKAEYERLLFEMNNVKEVELKEETEEAN